jgi:hypothetical protein
LTEERAMTKNLNGRRVAFRMAIGSYRVFVHVARTSYHALDRIQKVMIAAGVVTVVLLAVAYAGWGWRSVTNIDPIATPDDLAKNGFSAVAVQSQFNDDLLSILDSASSVMPTEIHDTIQDSGQQDLHLEIPGTGMSVQDTVTAAKGVFHRDGHITAEIVWDGPVLRISGRVTRPGGEAHEFHAESLSGNAQEVIREGAKAAMYTYNPYVLASSILDQAQKDCEKNISCDYTDPKQTGPNWPNDSSKRRRPWTLDTPKRLSTWAMY